jgi:hypothetical protein
MMHAPGDPGYYCAEITGIHFILLQQFAGRISMRLWTLHPKYLDSKGLVALWRESLLARKVLEGKTKGYKNHPQLIRFRTHPDPVAAINYFLNVVLEEAESRGYSFDRRKIRNGAKTAAISETKGQLRYEWSHLKKKLKNRDQKKYTALMKIKRPVPHSIFRMIEGRRREWEKIIREYS